jgi:hypothetical protein
MRIGNFSVLALGGLVAIASQGSLAEEIYKSVDGDGKVTYSQAPLPGAKQVSTVDIQTLSPEERRAALRLRKQVAGSNAALDEGFAKREEAWRLADVEIRDATARLLAEESALESGREPRAEEWIGNVGGGTRMTEAYFERLKMLEDRVAQARKRLDAAYAARDALK